ncbi:MAG: hypothetical protein EKK31_01605 [Hyphomicrobiales bacterium]|nr:MAG: hypothetical protein EKK31_01605 [Hyphomicrobiales bacterium]
MKRIQANSEFDRRSVLFLGAIGAAALFDGGSSAQADEVKTGELAPGVTLKMLKEVPPIGPVPGFQKAKLMEITFSPVRRFQTRTRRRPWTSVKSRVHPYTWK